MKTRIYAAPAVKELIKRQSLTRYILTDMVERPHAKLRVKNFDPQGLEVADDERPQMEDVVSADVLSFLHHHHLGAQEGTLYGHAETAGACPDNKNLGKNKMCFRPAQINKLFHPFLFTLRWELPPKFPSQITWKKTAAATAAAAATTNNNSS